MERAPVGAAQSARGNINRCELPASVSEVAGERTLGTMLDRKALSYCRRFVFCFTEQAQLALKAVNFSPIAVNSHL